MYILWYNTVYVLYIIGAFNTMHNQRHYNVRKNISPSKAMPARQAMRSVNRNH